LRLYVCAAVILVTGLCSAALIWFNVEDELPPAVGYIVVDGKPQPIDPGSSRAYVREVQRYGGKMGVLFDEFNRWFAGFWHGKTLGLTVGWISLLAALALFVYASTLRREPSEGSPPGAPD